MKQSHEIYQGTSTSQSIGQTNLIVSGSTPINKTVSELTKGSTMYQIFSDNYCIYKISSSFEVLHRMQYRSERSSNNICNIKVFKIVEQRNFASSSLQGTREEKVAGHSESVNGEKYELYQLVKADGYGKKRISGFMIVKKSGFFDSPDKIYPQYYYESDKKVR